MNTPSGLLTSFCRIFAAKALTVFAFSLLSTAAYAHTITYTNSSSIALPNNSVASTYPSTINVSGGIGVVTKVTVTLNGLSQRPNDMDILLVGPTGVKVALTQDRGGNTTVSNQTWTFDDNAAAMIATGSVATGTYMPSYTSLSAMPSGAPGTPYQGLLSSFVGTDANGAWRLYIDDDSLSGSAGSLAGGWSIAVSYGQVFTSTGSIAIPGVGSGPAVAAPYANEINVSGYPLSYITKAKVRLNNFAHTWPEDVALLLVGPTGQSVRLMADVGGSGDFSGELIFDSDAQKSIMDNGTVAIPAGTYLPSTGDDSATGGSDPMIADFPMPAPVSPYNFAPTSLQSFYATQPNGTWTLYVYDDTASDTGSIGSWSLIFDLIAPTSAPAEVNGAVKTPYGAGIKNVLVSIQGGDLETPMHVLTGPFGRYKFKGLSSGQNYIISVGAKRYVFEQPVRVLNLNEGFAEVDFISSY